MTLLFKIFWKFKVSNTRQQYVVPKQTLNSVFCSITVLDDEQSDLITAGSIVTVNVRLTRENLSVMFDNQSSQLLNHIAPLEESAVGCMGDYQNGDDEEVDNDEQDEDNNKEEKEVSL